MTFDTGAEIGGAQVWRCHDPDPNAYPPGSPEHAEVDDSGDRVCTDAESGVAAGPGCTEGTHGGASCPIPRTLHVTAPAVASLEIVYPQRLALSGTPDPSDPKMTLTVRHGDVGARLDIECDNCSATVWAGGGDDTIAGGGTVYGEAGDDDIHFAGVARGGAGNDIIDTSGRIDGGPGDDVLRGEGNALITAGDGNDLVTGDAGSDTIYGGAGNDRLFGEDFYANLSHGNRDRLYGGPGNDRLWGGPGNDLLSGGPGRDRLGLARAGPIKVYDGDRDPGRDRLFGNGGRDILFSVDHLREFVHGGAGVDQAEVDAADDVRAVERSCATHRNNRRICRARP